MTLKKRLSVLRKHPFVDKSTNVVGCWDSQMDFAYTGNKHVHSAGLGLSAFTSAEGDTADICKSDWQSVLSQTERYRQI